MFPKLCQSFSKYARMSSDLYRFCLTKMKLFSKCHVPVCSIPLNAITKGNQMPKKKIVAACLIIFTLFTIQAPMLFMILLQFDLSTSSLSKAFRYQSKLCGKLEENQPNKRIIARLVAHSKVGGVRR